MTFRKSAAGFTLIELLVVLTVLTLLAGLVGPRVLGQLGGAKSDTASVQINDLEQAAELFMLDIGRFPTNEEGLQALVTNPGVPGWDGPYLRRNTLPDDPWGRAYLYRYPGEREDVDIYTLGANGQPGGSGEDAVVGNWNL